MKIAFYGSSLLSSYWNGAATYYRGLLRALAPLGYDVTFYEPDAYDRQKHRDIEPPEWCRVEVYPATQDGLWSAAAHAGEADVVIKASGVGFQDDALLEALLRNASPGALRVFWDVDAPATLAELAANQDHPTRAALREIDLVLTYGGGDPVVRAYEEMGARECIPVYNALDPETHHPVAPDARFEADLAFLGNRLPDREARVDAFFLQAARNLNCGRFLLGGSGWDAGALPPNVAYVGHVPTRDHNAFNVTPRAVLNVNRESMASVGFSPPTRVFEAAGAGACLITDVWQGVELFLSPGEEVLIARDGNDVADIMAGLTSERAREIGLRARERVLREHTYDRRARQVDEILRLRRARGTSLGRVAS
jgi:spore maturation protein CgeB